MELTGERLIPASVDATWAALNDPETLKACIAGCESLERTGDDAYAAVVAMKIGPVSARFKGNLKMTNVEAPNAYTINFEGQGGVAGFGKGSADVRLAAEGDATRLSYTAKATVGGKMAQVGARLIDAAAAKITDDFFKAFEAHLERNAAPASTVGDAGGAVAASGVGDASALRVADEAPESSLSEATAGSERAVPASAVAPAGAAQPGGNPTALVWLVAALVAVAAIYFVVR